MKQGKRNLVPDTAAQLRELVFAQQPDTLIGSLPELAKMMGVGIVTVQQTARILEHEGLLEVRRGPGGGYYGMRPDAAVLERSLAAFMRNRPASWQEALDMTSLLFNELVSAAANCTDPALRADLAEFAARADFSIDAADAAVPETEFQDILFRMVDRPLFELLTRVTLRFSVNRPEASQSERGADGIVLSTERWILGRRRIINAILAGDAELARFEADRNNRRIVLDWLQSQAKPD
jgi:GntR family transcriptional repressor for pyruvate dehydrogenase complex